MARSALSTSHLEGLQQIVSLIYLFFNGITMGDSGTLTALQPGDLMKMGLRLRSDVRVDVSGSHIIKKNIPKAAETAS